MCGMTMVKSYRDSNVIAFDFVRERIVEVFETFESVATARLLEEELGHDTYRKLLDELTHQYFKIRDVASKL